MNWHSYKLRISTMELPFKGTSRRRRLPWAYSKRIRVFNAWKCITWKYAKAESQDPVYLLRTTGITRNNEEQGGISFRGNPPKCATNASMCCHHGNISSNIRTECGPSAIGKCEGKVMSLFNKARRKYLPPANVANCRILKRTFSFVDVFVKNVLKFEKIDTDNIFER